MAQKWENLLFLHWPVSKESLESTIPEGLEVDLFEGDAWQQQLMQIRCHTSNILE